MKVTEDDANIVQSLFAFMLLSFYYPLYSVILLPLGHL